MTEFDESNRIVQLNVGGMSFSTFYKTLINAKYFSSLLNEDSMATRTLTNDKEIFIDRSGDLFRDILYFLRTAMVCQDDTDELRTLQEEARFYQLEKMVEKIEDKINIIKENNDQRPYIIIKDIEFLIPSSDSKSTYLVIEEENGFSEVFQIINMIQVMTDRRKCDSHYQVHCRKCKEFERKLLLVPTQKRIL